MDFQQAAALSDVGRSRTNNEDAVLELPGLLILSDGMGGHDAGEVASATAIASVASRAEEIVDVAHNYVASEVVTYLEDICQEAAAAVEEEGRRLGKQIGCTLVMAVRSPEGVFVAHVGDSRAYLLQGDNLMQLTTDHNLYQTLRAKGLPHERAAAHPAAAKLVQGLGFGPVDADVALVTMGRDDTLLLCSDGLHDVVTNVELINGLQCADVTDAAASLIEFANERGGPDNVSAVVARVSAKVSSKRVERRLDRLRQIPLFAGLNEAQLRNMVPFMHTVRFRAGDLLLEEGDEGHTCIILLEGTTEIWRGDIKLTEVGAGGHFGEMALTQPWIRSATVAAIEDGLAFSLSRDQYQELCRARPDIGIHISAALARTLANRLADLTERLELVTKAAQGDLNRA